MKEGGGGMKRLSSGGHLWGKYAAGGAAPQKVASACRCRGWRVWMSLEIGVGGGEDFLGALEGDALEGLGVGEEVVAGVFVTEADGRVGGGGEEEDDGFVDQFGARGAEE